MTRLLVFACLAASSTAAQAPPWTLENPALRLTVNPDGGFALVDKASGAVWRSQAPASSLKLAAARLAGRAFEAAATIDGIRWRLRWELAPSEPEAELELAAPLGAPMARNLDYPFAFAAPSSAARIVLPHKTGLWFGVEDAARIPRVAGPYACYGGSGLSMPWFGLTGARGGLLVLFETPADAGVDVRIDKGVFAPRVYWQPARAKVGYARRLRLRTVRGGYVEMAKYYRRLLMARREFVTLREKEQINPNVARLIGALDLHLRGNSADHLEIVRLLEARGVKRMLINSGAKPEALAEMRARGHLTGSYRIYTDIHPPRHGLPEALARGYTDHAYTRPDGSPVTGFAYSAERKTTYRCPLHQIPLMMDLVPPLVRENGYQALFLDVVTAATPRECYAPAHPLDRRTDIAWGIAALRYAASLNLVIGSEDGNDWAAPHLHYFEGMTMPRRFGYVRGVTVNTWPKPFELNEEYTGVTLNHRVRIPLWDLVFHDSVVSTWRWNFTPDRYPDPKWWDRHDLLHMIAGNMPVFLVTLPHLEKFADRIVETYKRCAEWNALTGWDELVDHRAVSAGGDVQESRFSSGWAVEVNFTAKPHYRTYRWR